MLPIASLFSNPIPLGITMSPGLPPVLVMLVFLALGAVEIIRSARAQQRARRAEVARPLAVVSPRVATSAKRPLAA